MCNILTASLMYENIYLLLLCVSQLSVWIITFCVWLDLEKANVQHGEEQSHTADIAAAVQEAPRPVLV